MVDKELCRETARRIENVDMDDMFDMGTWGNAHPSATGELNECNTVACAAGHVLMAAGYKPVYQGRSFLGYNNPGMGRITSNFSGHACQMVGIRDTPLFYNADMTAQQMSKFFDLLADGWHVSLAEEKVQGME